MTGVVQGRAIKARLGFYGWLYRYGPFTRLRLFAAKKLISYYENEMLYLDFPGDKSQILARLRTGDPSIAVRALLQVLNPICDGDLYRFLGSLIVDHQELFAMFWESGTARARILMLKAACYAFDNGMDTEQQYRVYTMALFGDGTMEFWRQTFKEDPLSLNGLGTFCTILTGMAQRHEVMAKLTPPQKLALMKLVSLLADILPSVNHFSQPLIAAIFLALFPDAREHTHRVSEDQATPLRSAMASLLSSLDSSNRDIQKTALELLAYLGRNDSLRKSIQEKLIQCMDDSSHSWLQAPAALSLGLSHDSSAVPILKSRLDIAVAASRWDLCEATFRALVELRHKDLLPLSMRIMAAEPSSKVKLAIAEVLGATGDRNALTLLQTLLSERSNPDERSIACAAGHAMLVIGHEGPIGVERWVNQQLDVSMPFCREKSAVESLCFGLAKLDRFGFVHTLCWRLASPKTVTHGEATEMAKLLADIMERYASRIPSEYLERASTLQDREYDYQEVHGRSGYPHGHCVTVARPLALGYVRTPALQELKQRGRDSKPDVVRLE